MNDVKTGRVVPYLTEMFRFQAWVALGKVAHPMSGEVERDLDGARAAIDLLSELETRTAGNRSDEESKLMQAVLTELRMNYVDEAKKPNPETSPEVEGAAEAGSEDTGSGPEAGSPADDAGADAKAGSAGGDAGAGTKAGSSGGDAGAGTKAGSSGGATTEAEAEASKDNETTRA